MDVFVLRVDDMPEHGRAYRFKVGNYNVIVLPTDAQIIASAPKGFFTAKLTVKDVVEARVVGETGEIYYANQRYSEEQAHTLAWHALALSSRGYLSAEHLLQAAEVAADPTRSQELIEEYQSGARAAHEALIKSVFNDEKSNMALNKVNQTFGGIDLSKAKINVHVGQPVEFKVSPQIVQMFKDAKSFSFNILAVGKPFVLNK